MSRAAMKVSRRASWLTERGAHTPVPLQKSPVKPGMRTWMLLYLLHPWECQRSAPSQQPSFTTVSDFILYWAMCRELGKDQLPNTLLAVFNGMLRIGSFPP